LYINIGGIIWGNFFEYSHKKDTQQTKDEFVKQLKKLMAQRGFVPATKDDSTGIYYLGFSKSNSWVTVTSDIFQSMPAEVCSDAKYFAEHLKACCFSTDVVYSDFAFIEMYNSTLTLH